MASKISSIIKMLRKRYDTLLHELHTPGRVKNQLRSFYMKYTPEKMQLRFTKEEQSFVQCCRRENFNCWWYINDKHLTFSVKQMSGNWGVFMTKITQSNVSVFPLHQPRDFEACLNVLEKKNISFSTIFLILCAIKWS